MRSPDGSVSPVSPPRPPRRQRLDQLLVERGLAATRAEAGRLVMAGRVRLSGRVTAKAGQLVPAGTAVEVERTAAYASRGGEKLAAALDAFGLEATGRRCLDVGASTGGFTDCLLQRGAVRVYAIDVGRGQLLPRLRADPRVVVRDAVNARYLDSAVVPEPVDLATVDVSFISLEKVLPAIVGCLAEEAAVVALVKPQFEVGRGQVGKGGVVRDPARHRTVVARLAGVAVTLGLAVMAVTPSPLRGPKGNREFFLHLARPGPGLTGTALEAAVAAAVGP
ncbi:MAG TPA: TlyA family RNA methyltransferase [Methylomirabilota bacterium]|nr:TlyA family RNA methyltransferase [Methylomirabilota bacterium]